MVAKLLYGLLAALVVVVLYFVAWPVPIEPVAWRAPPNPGYSGSFAVNQRLTGVEAPALGRLAKARAGL